MNMLWVFSVCSGNTYQEIDTPSSCRREEHYLVATLPLAEQVAGQAVGQTRLVVPQEVSADKPAVLARAESGIQQEGVIFRASQNKWKRQTSFTRQ